MVLHITYIFVWMALPLKNQLQSLFMKIRHIIGPAQTEAVPKGEWLLQLVRYCLSIILLDLYLLWSYLIFVYGHLHLHGTARMITIEKSRYLTKYYRDIDNRAFWGLRWLASTQYPLCIFYSVYPATLTEHPENWASMIKLSIKTHSTVA